MPNSTLDTRFGIRPEIIRSAAFKKKLKSDKNPHLESGVPGNIVNTLLSGQSRR